MMRPPARSGLFVVVAVLFGAQSGLAQELINRREQRRKMELVTPQMIYTHYCAHCHGDDGTGGGRLWPSELSPKPANLTALSVNEDYLIAAIRKGSGAHGKSNLCPPWGRTIAPANTQRLARYVFALRGDKNAGLDTPDMLLSTHDVGAVTDPFPWTVCVFIVAEIGLLLVMLRNRKGDIDHVRQNTAMRG